MKKIASILFVLWTLSGACVSGFAQTNSATTAPSGPRIEFAEPNYDFGRVDAGAAVKHVYVFTNTGDQVLNIKDVHPSCGCTTAGDYDKQVAPGKTGKISIQFNSAGYSGAVHKSISVTSDDPTKPNFFLGLSGGVWKAFDVMPSYAVFNLAPEEQTNQTQVVRIVSNNDEPVAVSDPACNNPAFKLELSTVKEGKEYALRITASPAQINGNASSTVTLKTSSEKMPVISLMVWAMVQPLLSVNPPQIALPPGPLPREMEMTLTVQNNSTNSVVLSDAKINGADGATVQLSERQTGKQFNLVTKFPAGFQAKPGVNVQLTVKSSNPKFPLIIIPIIQPMPATIPVPAATPSNSATNHHA